LHSFTESPPNEFRFQDTDSLAPEQDDDDDQTILERAHVNIIEEPVSARSNNDQTNPIVEKMTISNDKENKIPEQSISMTVSTLTINPTNDPSLDGRKRFDFREIKNKIVMYFRRFGESQRNY